jgi:hypothetical protein
MTERLSSPENNQREDYWWRTGTQKGVMEYLGSSAASWDQMSDIQHEFLAFGNIPKLNRTNKNSPFTIIEPGQFPDFLRDYQSQVELHASLWQKDSDVRPGYPSRVILVWDIDLFDKTYRNRSVDDPEVAFSELEPVYQLMRQALISYNIPHIAITSGRGYNFVTQIPAVSPVMDDLINLSGPLEPTVLQKQAHPNPSLKRTKPIPPITERAHLAAGRLEQYLFNRVIRAARRQSKIPVEISDKGERGISFDNTAMVYPIENRIIGALGTPYFMKPRQAGAWSGRTIIRIPRAGSDFELSLDEVIQARSDYGLASDLLDDADCKIPDGSLGLGQLIKDYLGSDLRSLHQALDSSFGDPPESFEITYRNYDSIAKQTAHPERIWQLINQANDELLKPDNLDFFIWEIFKAWGGSPEKPDVAPHVAGLIRAIYEDGRLLWGYRWYRQLDALRYARSWVALILGQAYELEA